jgi:type I restriction enzyme M protein
VSVIERNPFREETRRLVDRLRSMGLSGSHLRDLFTVAVLLRWADYQEAEEEAMAEFEDRQWHSVLPPRLRWRIWFRLPAPELGRILFDELPAYLTGLRSRSETALAAYLSALSEPLQHVATTNIGVVCDVVHWVGDQPLETNNDRRLFLEFFDSLLEETIEKREGEFVTPQSIAKLAVAIADPGPGDRVYDPCFGFGGFLTTAWEVAERNAKGLHGRRTGEPLSLFGMEINSSAYLVGLTRVILSGAFHPRLERGNSLEREPAAGQNVRGFDIVLANPPMGARFADETWRYHHFPIRTRDSTSLFIQHILQQLRPQGRAVISVPEGFLFRTGAELELRRYLVERGHLQTVVALPEGAFAPHTMVRGSLLVLRKERGRDRVRMIDARSFFQRAETGRALELPLQQIDRLAAIANDPSNLGERSLSSSDGEDLGQLAPANLQKMDPFPVWTVSASELAAVDWDLTPRRREKGGLDQLLSVLQRLLRESGRIVRLDECAEIIAGRSVASTDLVNQPQGERPAAYIRIRDIRKGVASEGSNWVGAAALSTIEPKWRLLPGDLLLSKSGTIGKAGVVRNGAVGAIAANGLYVVRVNKEQLDPHFLLAYFASSACQNWLASQSRGVAIQHLNRPILDQLPVPVVPISLQHRAAMQFREHGTDVVNFLTEALGATDRDPIAVWLADTSRRFPNTIDAISDPLSLSPLEVLWETARPLRNQVAHAQVRSPLAPWLLSFAESLRSYQGLSNIPKGPALFSLITESLRGLQRSRELIQGYLPAEAQARDLNDLLLKWLDRAVGALLANVNLVFTPASRTLQMGEQVEVSISVENLSSLPLRNLDVVTAPDWGRQTFAFVGDGKSFALNLRGEAPKLLGVFSLTAEWSAQTLDGQEVRGNRQISFDVVETEQVDTQAESLGSSPYVTGTPLYPSRDDVFFGRRPLLEQISRQITASGNVVLLEGNRRSGKSSVLHHLEGTTAMPRWLAVYCSLQGMEGSDTAVGVPTVEIFRKIADSIATSLTKLNIDTPLPNGKVLVAGQKALGVGKACKEGISESSPFTDCREYIQVVLDLLATRDLGLVLMLDEFDKLQEGIESGITSPQVPENIRYLVQTCPRFSAILTGSRRLKRLRHEYWSALYGLGTRFGVSALEADDARRLVAEPVRGKLTFSPEATDRVISITACQPYLLQCLCNHIFDFAAHTKTRSITLDAIEHAAASYIKDNEHFASLWGYAETDRRRLILILCSKRADDDLLMFGALQELLLQHGIELAEEELEEDLAFLRELELIDLVGKIGDGHYKLSIPLMGRWIEQQQDFDIVLRKAQAESEERHV